MCTLSVVKDWVHSRILVLFYSIHFTAFVCNDFAFGLAVRVEAGSSKTCLTTPHEPCGCPKPGIEALVGFFVFHVVFCVYMYNTDKRLA